ncbi:hypothetical protein, partial [Pyramidobacter sp.]|uniref:hypothetical protein n=1 Tax=Pyramidobacter sp. TaxID=1943581 RepID=UPI0033240FA5
MSADAIPNTYTKCSTWNISRKRSHYNELYYFSIKAPNNPLSCGNTPYGLSGEISDRAAQTLDNVLKRRKNLVS